MSQNPFVISGYRSEEYFCNRQLETERLLSSIKNQRHLTLFSLRRMGKTGLIWHVFNQLKPDKSVVTVYVDIMPTLNLSDFTLSLAKAVFSTLAQKQSVIKKLLTALASLRPTLSYDSLTGDPEISIKIDSQTDAEYSLESVFKLLASQDQQFIIALDEFQQISSYAEKGVEALIRSHVQKLSNVVFLFSGSRRHLLSDIFSSPNRPFFNSTEIMEIDTIEADSYKSFIDHHFQQNNRKIQDEALDEIQQYTALHTFYVQFLCNRLYGTGRKTIKKRDVVHMFRQVIAENESIYASYINLITPMQFRLLKAFAKDSGAGGITSKKYLKAHNLGAASSVNTASKSLLDKDFIFQEDDRYFVIDKFFRGWLADID